MERNIRLVIAYDGTEFHGWQHQPGLRTVQEQLEQAARRVCRHQVKLIAGGMNTGTVGLSGSISESTTETITMLLRHADIAAAEESYRAQAEEILAVLQEKQLTAAWDSELVALIAYLQRLGRNDFSTDVGQAR